MAKPSPTDLEVRVSTYLSEHNEDPDRFAVAARRLNQEGVNFRGIIEFLCGEAYYSEDSEDSSSQGGVIYDAFKGGLGLDIKKFINVVHDIGFHLAFAFKEVSASEPNLSLVDLGRIVINQYADNIANRIELASALLQCVPAPQAIRYAGEVISDFTADEAVIALSRGGLGVAQIPQTIHGSLDLIVSKVVKALHTHVTTNLGEIYHAYENVGCSTRDRDTKLDNVLWAYKTKLGLSWSAIENFLLEDLGLTSSPPLAVGDKLRSMGATYDSVYADLTKQGAVFEGKYLNAITHVADLGFSILGLIPQITLAYHSDYGEILRFIEKFQPGNKDSEDRTVTNVKAMLSHFNMDPEEAIAMVVDGLGKDYSQAAEYLHRMRKKFTTKALAEAISEARSRRIDRQITKYFAD